MNEQELLVDTLRRLNRAGAPYMLTGSMASNYWGIPRTTHDLDFVIQLAEHSISKFAAEFKDGLFLDEQSVRSAFRPPHQFNVIDSRSALKINFWLPKGIPFETEMFRRRTKASIFGETAWVATKEDILLHKLLWSQISPSDRRLSDAAGIAAVQKGFLDVNYLKQWASELAVETVLDQILDGSIKPKST